MTKQKLPLSDKQYLWARDSDRMTKFVADNGRIRGAYVQGNLVVREMAANHGLGIYETFVLGQAYLAALLMTSSLKGEDRLTLSVQTGGPAGGFTVDANPFGEVRGHLAQTPFQVPSDWDAPTIAQIMGTGLLSVTRFLEGSSVPATGTVEYESGSLAQSLVHYFDQSEQIPTAIDLSVLFDREGNLLGASGLILQALPGHDTDRWEAMAQRLYHLPSIGENAAENHDPKALLDFWFSDYEPRILTQPRVEFFCPCSKEKFAKFLKGLPADEQSSILAEGPIPLTTTCHNCNSSYTYDEAELRDFWKK